MHIFEGLQCGLPLLYHEDGGGIVEVGRSVGVGFRDELLPAIHTMQQHYREWRASVLTLPPLGQRMCQEYLRVIRQACSGRLEERLSWNQCSPFLA